MAEPLAQASRILLHFDIAAVPSSCVVSDLYGNSFRPASLLSSILSLGEAESCCLPPRGVTKTDQMLVFAVNWQLSAFVVS